MPNGHMPFESTQSPALFKNSWLCNLEGSPVKKETQQSSSRPRRAGLVSTILTACSAAILPASGAAADCSHEVEASTAKLTWTGYKFTEKTPVSGSFDNVTFEQKKGASIAENLSSITFRVDTASINSDNLVRDKKLALFIFGRIVNPGEITGQVLNVDPQKKQASARITMNGVNQTIPFEYTSDEKSGVYSFAGKIDLMQFNMNSSVQAIHESCKDLHIGTDGKSKTWSEVGLKIDARINSTSTG